jgi:hypothetical protein
VDDYDDDCIIDNHSSDAGKRQNADTEESDGNRRDWVNWEESDEAKAQRAKALENAHQQSKC